MNLNMAIIADYLDGVAVTGERISRLYSLRLKGLFVYRSGGCKEPQSPSSDPDRVVLCHGDDFPPLPSGRPHGAVICIGPLPGACKNAVSEYICVDESTDMDDLVNAVSAVFAKFGDWSARIERACYGRLPTNRLGVVGVEVFQNDFCLIDGPQRMLFHSSLRVSPGDAGAYAPEDGGYFPQEQIEAYFADKRYQELLGEKRPVICDIDVLPFRTLMLNLFDGEQLIGQLTLDETVREIRRSDYSLLYYFGQYAKEVILREDTYGLGFSEEFDRMIDKMASGNYAWEDLEDRVLASRGWHRTDSYKCAVISHLGGGAETRSLSQISIYLKNHFDQLYVSKSNQQLVVVFNLEASAAKGSKISEKLSPLLNQTNYSCGLSSTFSDLADLFSHRGQALMALEAGSLLHPDEKIFSFEHYALDILLSGASAHLPRKALLTRKIRLLDDYDKAKGADLVLTLKTYLRANGNATTSIEKLNIFKTTFYHRLKRIREISGLDLDDYRTRLYLLNLFELLERESA